MPVTYLRTCISDNCRPIIVHAPYKTTEWLPIDYGHLTRMVSIYCSKSVEWKLMGTEYGVNELHLK